MRRGKTLAAAAGVALLAACASSYTPAQRTWMAARDQQPLNFVVPASEAEAAWARAQEWIARFGELPILTSNDAVIQTQQPEYPDASIGMKAVRTKLPNGDYQFYVDALVTNVFSQSRMHRAAQACAYYIASGIPYPGAATPITRRS